MDKLSIKIPLFGNIIDQATIARIALIKANLFAAGGDVLEILDIAKPLVNNVGTAMGMYFRRKNSNLIILPGVPLEMEVMLDLYLNSQNLFKVKKQNIVTINTSGIYETKLSNKYSMQLNAFDFLKFNLVKI